MPLFQVKARDEKGALRTPLVDAESRQAAVTQVRAAGLLVSEVKPHHSRVTGGLSKRVKLALLPITPQEQALFFRHLAPLIKTGTSPSTALRKMASRLPDPRMCELCVEMATEIDQGASLSVCLTARVGVFPAWVGGSVSAAEQGGRLEEILPAIGGELRREAGFASRFAVPLAYLRVSFVLAALVPTLPFLMNLGVTGWGVLAGVVGLITCALVYGVGFLRRYRQHLPGARDVRFVALVPGMADMRKELALLRFVRILRAMLASGLSTYEAWAAASAAVDDPGVLSSLEAGGGELAGEGGFSEALRLTGFFDNQVTDAAKEAEACGRFDPLYDWLLERGEYRAERAADRARKGVWSALLLLAGAAILIGAVVGFAAYFGNLLVKIQEFMEGF